MTDLSEKSMTFMNYITAIEKNDPELAKMMVQEAHRQQAHIELIASENYASRSVMEAQGSWLTNKYAEGYPGRRSYGGCEAVDHVESLAIDRGKTLFGAQYVNVQPHSGSQANSAVFLALLKPGDKILGMDLSAGGHLTHGSSVNFSGKLYEPHFYGVRASDGLIDYDEVQAIAQRVKPKLLIAGFSAYSRVVDWKRFREIADSVGAYLLADMAHVSGLVAAGLYPNPVDHAHVVTSTTHKTLRGPRSGIILSNEESLFKKLNSCVFPGSQGGPLMHVIAAKAVCFLEAASPTFVLYQRQVIANAQAMAKSVQELGGVVVSGGTDTHQFSIDLTPYGITGQQAETWLEMATITLNKNTIPNDPLPPTKTSGVRVGTAAITTRGFMEEDCRLVGRCMVDIFEAKGSEAVIAAVKDQMKQLALRYPLENLL